MTTLTTLTYYFGFGGNEVYSWRTSILLTWKKLRHHNKTQPVKQRGQRFLPCPSKLVQTLECVCYEALCG